MSIAYDEGKFKLNGVESPFHCALIWADSNGKTTVFSKGHYHDYIEILYSLKSSMEVILDGRRYHMRDGDLMVINSGEVHTIHSQTNGNRYIVVKFSPELLYAAGQSVFELKYALPFILDGADHQRLFSRAEIQGTEIPGLMKTILHEWSRRRYGYEIAIRTDILQLFLWILRYWHETGKEHMEDWYSNELTGVIQKAIEYIATHYDSVSAQEMARRCNMSYSYFSRSFKAVMKKSFTEYVNYIRLEQAVKLLVTTDKSVTEIAAATGFSTTSYFIEQFKKKKQISPRQFRLLFEENLKETSAK